MNKRMKRIGIVFAVVLLLLCIGLGVAGNYFYVLAVNAHSDKTIVFGVSDENSAEEKAKQEDIEYFLAEGVEDVWLTNQDGYRLHAYEKKSSRTDRWVVVVHGYISEAKNMASYGTEFLEMGYSVLMPDLRGHGQSDGDNIGMGSWDSDDVIEWVSYILKENPDAKIALYGVSMGASTVMMATGKQLPENVVVAVEDCGYTSAWDEFSFQLDDLFGLPAFPFLDAANLVTKIRAGYDLKDADALSAVARSKTPTLFIHGDADDFVPTDMVYPLYEAAASEKELLIIKGAGHSESRTMDPEKYWGQVKTFLERYMN